MNSIMKGSAYDDDEVINITKDTAFNIPTGRGNAGTSKIFGGDVELYNTARVNGDVLSRASSDNDSESGESYRSDRSRQNRGPSRMGRFDTGVGITGNNGGAPRPPPVPVYSDDSDSVSDATESVEEEDESEEYGSSGGASNRYRSERSRLEAEVNEKTEILYQFDRLESKGYRVPRKFTIQSDLDEMRAEYHRIVREKEVDASVRFQRKMLMSTVTGIEYLNGRFDPFDVKLDGWSESVHENVNDYDDIFEELHDKYKSSGKKMAPELRLLLSLSGSAFMFHLTSRMFNQSKVPDVEEVIRSDPELMKHFQNATLNRMAGGGAQMPPRPAPQPQQQPSIFSMLGSMFGMGPGGGGPQQPMPPAQQAAMNRPMPQAQAQTRQQQPQMTRPMMPPPQPQARRDVDVEDIINNMHAEITTRPGPGSRVETMSISDEEITSIIEDATDIRNIAGGSASNRRGRTKKATPQRTFTL